MSVQVTRTKVIIPRRRSHWLSRQRLLDALDSFVDDRLILIVAPAGYGKTSLLVDFAQWAEMPLCWYALDAFDRDPQRFFAHLIAAIAQRFPVFGRQSQAALEAASQATLDLDQLVTVIVNDIFENISEHFLFVLDDYHLIDDRPEIVWFLNRFVQAVSENCHLVLSTRRLPALSGMPLLVARAQVRGLSFEDLAFRAEEIQSLVEQNYHIQVPAAYTEELLLETEGWITGLLLTAQSIRMGVADPLRLARISGVGLYDYLAQQVLDQQLPAVRDFLLKTSLVGEFDTELCAAVLGEGENWAALIDTVLQNNLFVLPVGEDGRWIRYHHLFQEFLVARLSAEQPEEKMRILRQLVGFYSDRSEWDKSHAICQQLGDLTGIADLVEQAGSPLVRDGRLSILAEWIDVLPEPIVASRPKLLSHRGIVHIMQGQVEIGLLLLNQAESAQRVAGDRYGLARTLTRRAFAYQFKGEYCASLDDASEALALSEHTGDLDSIRADALRALGLSLYYMGRLSEAIEKLSGSLAVYGAIGDRQNVAMVHTDLGLTYMGSGRYPQALAHYQQALDYWRGANNFVGQVNLFNNLGVLHHLMGKYDRAAAAFNEGLVWARQCGYARGEPYILCGLGDLYADLDAVEAALEAYRAARELALQLDYRFLQLYIDLAEAAQSRLKGDMLQAKALLHSAEALTQESNSSFERGLCNLEAGQLALAEEKNSQAIGRFEKAAHTFETGGQPVEAARAHLWLAAAHLSSGNLLLGVAGLQSAFRLTADLEDQQVLVPAGRKIRNVLETVRNSPVVSRQVTSLLKQVDDFEESLPSLRRRIRPHAVAVPFAPPQLNIRALGRVEVELDGHPVTVAEWQNQRRAREVFFYLLAHDQKISKETLGLVFWPDSSPAQMKLQFKNTIYRLRYALGREVILYDADLSLYWFNRALDYEYDVETFQDRLAQASVLDSPQAKIVALQKALEVYHGSYLPTAEGAWVVPERERLWQLCVEASLSLAELLLAAGEPKAVLKYCQLLLDQDACLEEAYCLSMRAYAALGNRRAVIRQYERCCKALLEEANAKPSRQTEMLYQELRG
jgi:ATP/maltotriose-dependent transcriptional regulator MalT/DNA-binding SARP family transcriptional activator